MRYVNDISIKLEKIPNNQNTALKWFDAKKKNQLNSSTKIYLFNSIILSKRHAAGYQRNTFHIELKSWPLGSPRSWLTPWPWHSPDDWSANLSLSFLSNRVRTTSEDHYPRASPLKGLLYSDPRVPAEPAWRCLPCSGSGPASDISHSKYWAFYEMGQMIYPKHWISESTPRPQICCSNSKGLVSKALLVGSFLTSRINFSSLQSKALVLTKLGGWMFLSIKFI